MIYISTGGFKNLTGVQAYKKIKTTGHKYIELSAGKYSKELEKKIIKIKSKDTQVQSHNYFPPYKKPFVFNLGSLDSSIAKMSINHVKRNILFSKKINSKFFSFHAGFRVDPHISQLGKRFSKSKLISKRKCMQIFVARIKKLVNFAKKHKINLLIENNVVTEQNFKNFGTNPFLLTNPKDIKSFFTKLRDFEIGFLCDLGHLKVSSKTEKFNLKKAHNSLKKFIKAYHISDNNGVSDSNSPVKKNSWFLKDLKKNAKFYTIEVYTESINTIKNQIKLIESFVN